MLLATVAEQKKSSSSDSSKREGKVVNDRQSQERSREQIPIPQPADPVIINELPPKVANGRTSKDLDASGSGGNPNDPNCLSIMKNVGAFSSICIISPLSFSLLVLTVQSLGIIYGDIGTSPLYVFSSIFSSTPPTNPDDYIAACSLIIWSLFLVVMLKYVTFILLADNHGEGGVFALGGLLISKRSTLHRYGKFLVKIFMIIGGSFIFVDGGFTPAVSVLSAIGGISFAQEPNLTLFVNATANETLTVVQNSLANYVVLISIILLILLFIAQPLGTNKIGWTFGPIMLLWFFALGAIGIWRITTNPRCLTAFNPALGIVFLANGQGTAYLQLGAVFLCVTGVEALYSDLGHFGAWPIRVSWTTIVFPALLLQYLGQTAVLLNQPYLIPNIFYYTAPTALYWPMLVLATLATIIASQAIISASFSLSTQAIALGFLPPFSVIQTSKKIAGQIYVPFTNLALLAITLIFTYGFGTSSNITNAYGFTICSMLLITTAFYSLSLYFYYHLFFPIAMAFMVFFVLDGVFWGAILFKVPQGGWVAILFSVLTIGFMFVWSIGEYYLREYNSFCIFRCPSPIRNIHESYLGHTIPDLVSDIDKYLKLKTKSPLEHENAISMEDTSSASMVEIVESHQLNIGTSQPVTTTRTTGVGVFFQTATNTIPLTFDIFLQNTHALPQIVIFLELIRNSAEVTQRYTAPVHHGHGVYSLAINLSILERAFPLTEALHAAFTKEFPHESVEELASELIYYTSEAYVQCGETVPWYLYPVLKAYSILKSSFPGWEMPEVALPPDRCMRLIHCRVL